MSQDEKSINKNQQPSYIPTINAQRKKIEKNCTKDLGSVPNMYFLPFIIVPNKQKMPRNKPKTRKMKDIYSEKN